MLLILRSTDKVSSSQTSANFSVQLPALNLPDKGFTIQLVNAILQLDTAVPVLIECDLGSKAMFDSHAHGPSTVVGAFNSSAGDNMRGPKVFCHGIGASSEVTVRLRDPESLAILSSPPDVTVLIFEIEAV